MYISKKVTSCNYFNNRTTTGTYIIKRKMFHRNRWISWKVMVEQTHIIRIENFILSRTKLRMYMLAISSKSLLIRRVELCFTECLCQLFNRRPRTAGISHICEDERGCRWREKLCHCSNHETFGITFFETTISRHNQVSSSFLLKIKSYLWIRFTWMHMTQLVFSWE